MRAMYQSDPTLNATRGPTCAEHAQRPASTICNRCGSYTCDACLRVGFDRLDYCYRCLPETQPPLAERGERFVANFLDRLAPAIPMIIGFVVGGLVMGNAGNGEGMAAVAGFGLMIGLGFLGALAVLGFQLYLLATTGQSLGKRAMGIKVVRTDGSPADVMRVIFLRNVVPELIGMVSCNLFSLVDPLIIFTDERRCLHDHIADTKVIRVPR